MRGLNHSQRSTRFPCRARVFQQFLGGHRLISSLRHLGDHLCVIRKARQIALRKPTIVAPPLDRRRSKAESLCQGRKPNTFNSACHRAHLCQSVHQLCKVATDRKCKHGGSDLAGGSRYPRNDVLGQARGIESGRRLAVRSIRYRSRARLMAECCPEMARRRKLSIPQKHDRPGEAPGSQS